MIEIWKDIEGYEGLYQVSNFGNIKSLERFVHSNKNGGQMLHISEKILRQQMNNRGYMIVILNKDGVPKKFRVHRLVAFAFVDGYKDGYEVDHIDGCKTNNAAINLRWADHSTNCLNPNTNNVFYRRMWC